jgi:cell wall-associated NlpC family hydrolase
VRSIGRARFPRPLELLIVAAATLLLALLAVTPAASARVAHASSSLTFERVASPQRTLVYEGNRLIAAFTDGSRTVAVAGRRRTFTAPSASHAVTTRTWVRLLERPFAGKVDLAWLTRARDDGSPDVLATAMRYVAGAPVLRDRGGLRIAGDASYGPLLGDGTREEGSDFNDYLGVSWSYGTSDDAAEPRQLWSLDCSGFVRMVYGYRLGHPLSLRPVPGALPRRAHEMATNGPGVVVAAKQAAQLTTFTALAAGDLVFFDVDPADGSAIDHVGIYVGRDTGGHHRFISSRKTPDGPTLGDDGARSVLDGGGYYARGVRMVRRL